MKKTNRPFSIYPILVNNNILSWLQGLGKQNKIKINFVFNFHTPQSQVRIFIKNGLAIILSFYPVTMFFKVICAFHIFQPENTVVYKDQIGELDREAALQTQNQS